MLVTDELFRGYEKGGAKKKRKEKVGAEDKGKKLPRCRKKTTKL